MAKRDTSVERKSVGDAQGKPNILIIWGDDIGQSNLSCFTKGVMGYRTPNIDRIANGGMLSQITTPSRAAPQDAPLLSWAKACFAAGFPSRITRGDRGYESRGPDDRRVIETARLRDRSVR